MINMLYLISRKGDFIFSYYKRRQECELKYSFSDRFKDTFHLKYKYSSGTQMSTLRDFEYHVGGIQ